MGRHARADVDEREVLCEGETPTPGSVLGRCCRPSVFALLAAAAAAAALAACGPAAGAGWPLRRAEEARALAVAPHAPAPQIDVWYVNVEGMVDRDVCVRGQLEHAGVEPRRYKADTFSHCGNGSSHDFVDCLEQQGCADCVKGGIDWTGVRQHDGLFDASMEVVEHIVSNWCSHKRLFSKLAADTSAAEFVLVCEDDVSVDHTRLMPELQSFVKAWSGWDLVVVDPFVGQLHPEFDNCQEYEVGRHNGAPVWSVPQVESQDAAKDGCVPERKCSMCGAQAFLVRKSALRRIVSVMEGIPTVPLDWLPRQLPGTLSWKPNIASNPINMDVAWPSFCAREVSKSSIQGHWGPKKHGSAKPGKLDGIVKAESGLLKGVAR